MAVVAHGHQLDGMRVDGGFVAAACLYLAGMDGKVAGQLAGRHHGLVGNDDIRRTVVEDADDAAVVHRPSGQVAHTLARTFAIEITTFQGRQRHTNLLHFADSRQLTDFVVYIFGDVHCDIAAVTLGPAVLPQVSCDLGYFLNLRLQCRTAFQNTFHFSFEY